MQKWGWPTPFTAAAARCLTRAQGLTPVRGKNWSLHLLPILRRFGKLAGSHFGASIVMYTVPGVSEILSLRNHAECHTSQPLSTQVITKPGSQNLIWPISGDGATTRCHCRGPTAELGTAPPARH